MKSMGYPKVFFLYRAKSACWGLLEGVGRMPDTWGCPGAASREARDGSAAQRAPPNDPMRCRQLHSHRKGIGVEMRGPSL